MVQSIVLSVLDVLIIMCRGCFDPIDYTKHFLCFTLLDEHNTHKKMFWHNRFGVCWVRLRGDKKLRVCLLRFL